MDFIDFLFLAPLGIVQLVTRAPNPRSRRSATASSWIAHHSWQLRFRYRDALELGRWLWARDFSEEISLPRRGFEPEICGLKCWRITRLCHFLGLDEDSNHLEEDSDTSDSDSDEEVFTVKCVCVCVCVCVCMYVWYVCTSTCVNAPL